MKKRVITGALFAVLILAGIFLRGWPMLALLGFAMVVSIREMYHCLMHSDADPVRWTGYLFCALTIALQAGSMLGMETDHMVLLPLAVSSMLAMARLVFKGKIAVDGMMATVFPMLYPGIFFMMLMQLLDLKNPAVVLAMLVLAFFAASINDVFALFSGLLFGKHKLSPVLSPKKTIEGSIGGMLFCVAFCVAVPPLLKLIFAGDAEFIAQIAVLPPLWSFGVLGLIAGVFSQIGDLTASMIKRYCSVKDYGNLLPGHGGIMDRMDGVLFCGACCYLFSLLAGLN